MTRYCMVISLIIFVLCFGCSIEKDKSNPNCNIYFSDLDELDSLIKRKDSFDFMEWPNYDLGFGYSICTKSFGLEFITLKFKKVIDPLNNVIGSELTVLTSDINEQSDCLLDSLTTRGFTIKDEVFVMKDTSKEIVSIENKKIGSKNHELMSPFCGIEYGKFGGYISHKIENRVFFDKIDRPISSENLRYLLESINPATRLMAAEYYFNNFTKLKSDEMNQFVKYSLSSPTLFYRLNEDRRDKTSWFEALESFVDDKEILENFRNN